jgi:hypothetical protein
VRRSQIAGIDFARDLRQSGPNPARVDQSGYFVQQFPLLVHIRRSKKRPSEHEFPME